MKKSKEDVEMLLCIDLMHNIDGKDVEYETYQEYVMGFAEIEFTWKSRKALNLFKQGFNNVFDIQVVY